eukprot:SAG31_NODE_1080_length_10027_cov_8.417204_8_plen_454_part_00
MPLAEMRQQALTAGVTRKDWEDAQITSDPQAASIALTVNAKLIKFAADRAAAHQQQSLDEQDNKESGNHRADDGEQGVVESVNEDGTMNIRLQGGDLLSDLDPDYAQPMDREKEIGVGTAVEVDLDGLFGEQEGGDGLLDDEQEELLKEYESLRLSELHARAIAVGVPARDASAALDSDDPRSELSELLLQAELQHTEEFNAQYSKALSSTVDAGRPSASIQADLQQPQEQQRTFTGAPGGITEQDQNTGAFVNSTKASKTATAIATGATDGQHSVTTPKEQGSTTEPVNSAVSWCAEKVLGWAELQYEIAMSIRNVGYLLAAAAVTTALHSCAALRFLRAGSSGGYSRVQNHSRDSLGEVELEVLIQEGQIEQNSFTEGRDEADHSSAHGRQGTTTLNERADDEFEVIRDHPNPRPATPSTSAMALNQSTNTRKKKKEKKKEKQKRRVRKGD